MPKHILLVQDMTGYGKVALAAIMPVLSHMGHHLYTLPTAIVSNTLDYGQFEIHEMTDYMRRTLQVWRNLGFRFEAVSTGMIFSDEQAELVSQLCRESAEKGCMVFVDPVMGDEGKLYNGVTEATVGHMREMVAVADYTMPNYTEAAYLTGLPMRDDLTRAEADELVDALRRMGADTTDVKMLLQSDFQDTMEKYQIIKSARLYRQEIAVAALNTTTTRVLAAQAADELLNISGITASFVMYPDGDQIIISARSIGDANVQMILEPLGGGGNTATAGAQVRNSTVKETLDRLVASIDKYYEKD